VMKGDEVARLAFQAPAFTTAEAEAALAELGRRTQDP